MSWLATIDPLFTNNGHVGLAIVVANYRNHRSVQANEFSEMKG